ncbi:SLC25A29 [Symbiodinium sp. KB8]|nr:SLC25A29 [Symbiodinium sp. KB8]
MAEAEQRPGLLPREMASFIAGQVSFSAGLSVAYPLDTIKVRMQTVAGAAEGGMLAVARNMVATQGLRGFYNGLTSPLLGYGMAGAVAFSGNDWATRFLKRWRSGAASDAEAKDTHLSFSDAFMAGAFAGFVNNVPRTIVDRLKTVAQVQGVTTPQAVRYILHHQGVQGLLDGFGVTMVREVPQFGIYFSTFAAFMLAITPESGERPPSWQVAGVGALAGVIQWLPPLYCVDVVKSRLQGAPVGTYSSMRHCAESLYAEHGWRVFVRGLGPTIIRGLPLHATTFLTYETLMRVLSDGAAR